MMHCSQSYHHHQTNQCMSIYSEPSLSTSPSSSNLVSDTRHFHHHHHHHHHHYFHNVPIIWSNFFVQLESNQLSVSPIISINNVTSVYEDNIEMNYNTTTITSMTTVSQPSSTDSEFLLTLDTILTLILPYLIIFILSIVGNLLVIITLTLDRSMRSVTNIFLLNLAISDLLLGVFCMPFTLVGVLLRRFIFGAFMCHLISYFQAVSVAVSVWTLVAMSIERYYAICQPFRSRESRQSKRHAYRILTVVWTLAFITMSPTAIVSKLQLITQTGHYKCREAWPSFVHKQTFTIFLDIGLLIIPLIIMILTYSSIALTLRNNVPRHRAMISSKLISRSSAVGNHKKNSKQNYKTTSFCNNNDTQNSSKYYWSQSKLLLDSGHSTSEVNLRDDDSLRNSSSSVSIGCQKRIKNGFDTHSLDFPRTILRVNSSHYGGQNRQRRIITMLFVVVIEFFICWSPIFLLDTMALYRPAMVYGTSKKVSQWIGIDIISLCHLLCFCSSCTNPITYCFMNQRFRNHFMSLFRCRTVNPSQQNNLTIAQNSSSLINDQSISNPQMKILVQQSPSKIN